MVKGDTKSPKKKIEATKSYRNSKPTGLNHTRSRRYLLHNKLLKTESLPNTKSQSNLISKKPQRLRRLSLQSRRRSLQSLRRSLQSRRNSVSIREFKYNEDIRTEYNEIAQDTMPVFIPFADKNGNRVHFIFLFAGDAYIEQCFVSIIRSTTSIIIESISFVDLEGYYTDKNTILTGDTSTILHGDKDDIRRGFPNITEENLRFYGLDKLHDVPIHPNSFCIGFRPQINTKNHAESKPINDFITRYFNDNESELNKREPIYLIKKDKIKSLIATDGLNPSIESAITELYKPDNTSTSL